MKPAQIAAALKAYPVTLAYLSEAAKIAMLKAYVYPGDEISEKTEGTYFRQVWSRILGLYRLELSHGAFIGEMAEIVQGQITRAWRAALRDEGLDPGEASNIGGEYYREVERMILSEYDFVDKLAADVLNAGLNDASIEPLRLRAEMWANRYRDAYNTATLLIAEKQGGKLVWRMGEREEHCETCKQLDGTIAFATEWRMSGFRPQSPPNELLDCEGWQCRCKLEPTDLRRTPKALDKLLSIAVSRAV